MLLKSLMGSGVSAGLANAFAADITDNQTATGTTAADALVAGTAIVRCTTVPSGTGVQLINGVRGDSQIIINEGANNLNVYPPTGHTLNSLSADAPIAIAAGAFALFERVTNTDWLASNVSSTAMFLAAGSGAVARSMQGKARDIINVFDFIPESLQAGIQAGTEVTDVSSYIQAAIDSLPLTGGRLEFPYGDLYIASTLNFFRAGQTFSFNAVGAGMFSTRIFWNGATNGTAVKIRRAVRFAFSHIRIENNVAEGTTKGLQITAEALSSDTGPGAFINVRVEGFNENVPIGEDAGNSASELSFFNLETANTTYGVILRGANSLVNKFYGLNGSGCGTLLEAAASGPDCVWVYGGTGSNSTVQDFAFRESGAFGIFGFRSEGAARFCTFGADAGEGASSPTTATISGCRVANCSAADNRVIRLNKAGHYSITANSFADGHVYIDSGNTVSSSLELKHNTIVSSTDLEIEANAYNWRISKNANSDSATAAGSFWTSAEQYTTSGGINTVLTWGTHAETGTWTPTDTSGATLSLTAEGYYVREGALVTVTGNITYPATADGSAAQVGGLPFSSQNITSSWGGAPTYTDVGSAFTIVVVGNSTNIQFYDLAGAAKSNANLSTKIIRFQLTYRVA